MSSYEIADYGIFDDAVSATNSLNDTIDDSKNSIVNVKESLSSDSILMGPVVDEINNAFSSVESSIDKMTSNFNTISSYLKSTAINYKNGDTETSKTILTITDDGKVSEVDASTILATPYANSGTTKASGSELDFINSIKDGAVKAYNEYGVLPSLTMAQAILESGWGDTGLAKNDHNLFGIKAGNSWKGATATYNTSEQTKSGSTYTVRAAFRKYDSADQSIEDHAKLLSTDRYKPVVDSTNYKDACNAVKNCGYATDVNYPSKLINIIEKYGLNQWDPKG